jgi:pimeloyl-ACP methyl ester carboxylesterase
MTMRTPLLFLAALLIATSASAQSVRTIDIPTRPGATQRFLIITPDKPKAAVILFAGGDGGLTLEADGRIPKLAGNFLVRSRQQFADQGLTTVVIDAPSDRQSPPYLSGSRQTAEHVSDVKAVIAWLREQAKIPVWLIGTSRGTQSAAYIATQLPLAEGGADGIVLTSSIVRDQRSRAVPEMALDRVRIPVLVAHHRQDGCRACLFADVPPVLERLTATPRKELMVFDGGISVGDPCEARAYHGFNGIEREVIERIATWIAP